MADYSWPDASKRTLIGKRISRLDGPLKVTGVAKYSYDVNRSGMLFAKILRCPHAHARITSLDTSAAEAVPGVKAVRVIQGVGSEIKWELDEVLTVAAETEEAAEDGVRAIRIDYEVLSHFVTEEDRANAPDQEIAREETEGDPAAAMASADVRSKGFMALPPSPIAAWSLMVRSASGKAKTSSTPGAPPRRFRVCRASSPTSWACRPPTCG